MNLRRLMLAFISLFTLGGAMIIGYEAHVLRISGDYSLGSSGITILLLGAFFILAGWLGRRDVIRRYEKDIQQLKTNESRARQDCALVETKRREEAQKFHHVVQWVENLVKDEVRHREFIDRQRPPPSPVEVVHDILDSDEKESHGC